MIILDKTWLIGSALIRKKETMNLPNKITTFRLICVFIIDALILIPFETFCDVPIIPSLNISLIYLIVLILFILASFSDFLDGYIARKYNMVTNYGKFMDPIADKLLVNSLFILLTQYGPLKIPAIIPLVMVARDIIVDVMRMLAMEQGKVVAANIFGKMKTVTQMVALIFVLLNDWPFSLLNLNFSISIIICYIAMAISLLSGIIYIINNINLFKEKKDA